jgi:Immunity protein 21
MKTDSDIKWLKSGGGPLVCIGLDLEVCWLGVTGNSSSPDPSRKHASDYERACSVRAYLGKVPLGNGDALVLGDMPLETMIWHRTGKRPRIVRVFYGDSGIDIAEVLESATELDFDDPAEILHIQIRSGSMVVFDSAYAGADASIKRLSFELPAGKYRILTKQFLPDDRTSVLVHEFDPIR